MKEIILPNKSIAYEFEDISFVNTSLFTEAAQFYRKNGVYTKAHPASSEYKEYWDIEEDRIRNGMTAPGALVNGKIQEVKITGTHYAYLNYGRIKKTDNANYDVSKPELILKTRALTATKEVEFPDFWDGDYHFFKALDKARQIGKHLIVGKARRKGYSYKNGFACAVRANMFPRSTSIIGAFDKKYLIKGDGTMTMTTNYLQWFEEYTDFNRGFLTTKSDEYELGYVPQGTKFKKGYLSKVLALSFKDNPEAAIGKDSDFIIFEEAGKFPNLSAALDVTIPTMEDGEITTGIIVVFGTGGTKDADWYAFEQEFYRTYKHGFMPFVNVWDDDARDKTCGFFHSHLLNLKPYIDENGNSIIEPALNSTLQKREERAAQSDKAQENDSYIALRCIKPSEIFAAGGTKFFSSEALKQHYEKVKHDEYVRNLGRVGRYSESNGVITFVPNSQLPESDKHPQLTTYHYDAKDDINGAIVEWYPPFRKPDGNIPMNLYRAWHDPYALEKDREKMTFGDSLGATYVYERPNNYTTTGGDIIVASFVGRPESPDDYNEQLLKFVKRYNADLQFESDRGDVMGYFKSRGCYNLLADEPDFDWKREISGTTGRKKGIAMYNSERKGTAAMLLKQWLYTKRGSDLAGNPKYTFHYIYDLALLEELLKWNLKGNFDRVSALLIGVLDKHEIFNKQIEEVGNADYTTGEPNFFFRDWFN